MKKFLWTLLLAAFLMPMAAHAQCTDGTPCQFTISGEDTYGDGWEGSLTIYRNNTQMAVFDVDDDDSTVVYTVCQGDTIRIEWTGSDNYGENFFTITSNGMTYVSDAHGYTYAPSGTVVEFTACPSCLPVTNVTVSGLSSYGATLTWSDAFNTGATYTIYNMADTTIEDSYVTDTTYTFSSLTAGTAYTFAIVANCSATDESSMTYVSFNTLCEAFDAPFTENFEANSTSLTCWDNSGDAEWSIGVGDYSTSTGAHSGSANARITHTSTGDVTKLITPVVDLTYTTAPQLVFWHVQRSWSGDIDQLNVYYRVDPDSAWTLLNAYTNAYSTWTEETINLPNPSATYQIAFEMEDNYGYGIGLDDVYIGDAPSCFPVVGLTVSNISDNSVTLTWRDTVNSGATYTVYNMADTSVIAANISDTTYTVTGLNSFTDYSFGVEVNCSATDVARIATVNTRTACGTETMPWSENFDSWTSKSECWSFLSGPFTGGTPTAYSYAWSLNNSYGSYITLSGNALTMNVYSTNRYWAVTPTIAITSDSATLSVDVAVAAWSAETPSYDADDTLAFAISTDGGTTFTALSVYNNTQLNALTGTYTTLTVPVNGYNNQNVRFAIFAGSSASGGDNRIAIDNIAVTGESDTTTNPVLDSFVVVLGVNDATMGTTAPAPGTYAFHLGETASAMAVANTGYHFVRWEQVIGSFVDTTVANPATHVIDSTMLGLTMTMTAIFAADSTVDTGSYYYLTVNYDSTMGDVFYFEGPYEAGDSAFVMAWANPGYRFVNWTEGTTVVSTDNPYEFVMNADVTLTANFEVDSTASADSLTIITAVNDATMGTITPAPGTHHYGVGDVFTVTATPNSGYFFEGWVLSVDYGFFAYTDTLVGMPSTYSDTVTEDALGVVMSFTALFTADSVPVVNPDSIVVTFAVNDATMGTINPAPGTYTYAETDSIHVVATPNSGYYFIGWHLEASYYGFPVDTIVYTTENRFDESFEDMGGMVLTLTALFSADTNATMYTVTVSANNSTMGTVSGGGVYAEGSTVTITATPNEGFSFQGWVIDGDTIATNPYTFTITGHVNAVAVFVANSNGIDDADMANVNIYGADGRIIVRGAEGKDVYVYDLNGRTVSSRMNAADAIEFRVAGTGVYLVKVGNAAAKRVLVAR